MYSGEELFFSVSVAVYVAISMAIPTLRTFRAGLPEFVDTFSPKRSFVVGTGGVSLDDFLISDVEAII